MHVAIWFADGWIDGWIDGCLDYVWTAGLMDRWIDGLMDCLIDISLKKATNVPEFIME